MSVLTDNDILELMHSSKGTTWANHKYIAIKNGRYIYADNGGGSNSKKGALDADLFRSRIWRRHKAKQLAKNKQKYNTRDFNPIKSLGNNSSKKGGGGGGSKGSSEDKKAAKLAEKEALKKQKEEQEAAAKMESITNILLKVVGSMKEETLNKLQMDDESNVKYLIATYLNINPETLPKDKVSELTKIIKTRYLKHVEFSEFYDDYLAHFGILGMKWGKRNGPPYPLSKLISTGRRLKKEYKEKRAVNKEKRTLENPKKLYKNRDKYTNEQIRSALDRIRVLNDLRDASIKKKNRLKQKIDFINGYLKSGGDTLNNINKIRQGIANLANHAEKEKTGHMQRLKAIAESDASIQESKTKKQKAKKEQDEIKNEESLRDEINKLKEKVKKLESEKDKKDK